MLKFFLFQLRYSDFANMIKCHNKFENDPKYFASTVTTSRKM